jgi:formiminoglutamase
VKRRYPFLISIPHGGTRIPPELDGRLQLGKKDIRYYSDPDTRKLFGFGGRVAAHIEAEISRMLIDLNRPPLPLPPRDPDGIIKIRTVDGRPVYREGKVPDLPLIHKLLMAWYFPYHQKIDDLIDDRGVAIAFDCHSMLPRGSGEQKDAGKKRPLICLGNSGDRTGQAGKNGLTTCPPGWVQELALEFRKEFSLGREVAINNPFSGGFIANAHYWRKGIPWIQIEVNRALYEPGRHEIPEESPACYSGRELRERIWHVLTRFWDHVDTGP